MLNMPRRPGNGTIVVTILATLFVFSGGFAVWSGTKTGELQKKVIDPVVRMLTAPEKNKDPIDYSNTQRIQIERNTTIEVGTDNKLEIYTDGYPSATPWPTSTPWPTWQPPTYPTATPNPTLTEWKRQFDASWSDMEQNRQENNQKIQDFQTEYDKTKAEMCAQNPSFSFCK